MKYITKKIVKNSLLILLFTVIACCYSSISQAQGYMGKKTLIGYRLGISPWLYSSTNWVGSLAHEVSLERIKNRRISYGIDVTYCGGEQSRNSKSYDFNCIMPVVFFRIYSLRKGSIAPLGIANKLGLGIASQNYSGSTSDIPKSTTTLVFCWSVMKRIPLSKSLLFDYGTGITFPIIGGGDNYAVAVNNFNIRFGLTFATK